MNVVVPFFCALSNEQKKNSLSLGKRHGKGVAVCGVVNGDFFCILDDGGAILRVGVSCQDACISPLC